METCTDESKKKIERIETEKKNLTDMFYALQNRISQKYDQVLAVVECHQTRLMEEFDLLKKHQLEGLERSKEKEATLFLEMESFKSYCLGIDKSQLAWDTSVNGLTARAVEFARVQAMSKSSEASEVVTFAPSQFTADNIGNLIGRLFLEGIALSV